MKGLLKILSIVFVHAVKVSEVQKEREKKLYFFYKMSFKKESNTDLVWHEGE